jgi:nucleoside-diphosphate-sugar epimerase
MNLVVFGFGYTASRFVELHRDRFNHVAGTVRSHEKAGRLSGRDLTIRVLSPDEVASEIAGDIAAADALLVSIPPGPDGDPVLARFADVIAAAPHLAWIGYLSTIGVYGDQDGAWIDETEAPRPGNARSQQRVAAEQAWLGLGAATGKAVQVFRLAGIYGPGRGPLRKLAEGTAKRLVKPGQVFNRIHVDDIAAVLAASLDRPRAGAIYNVADDEPAPPQEVVSFAAALAGVEPPPEEPFETAELSPMARSFYGDNKRVRNRLIRDELGAQLAFPTYREGLAALRKAGEGPQP